MTATLTLPRLGETMEEGRVAGWLKKPGEAFRRGETIVEIETDKTVVELPALADGVLVEILAGDGAAIKVGEPLCRYDGAGEAAAAGTPATETPPAPAPSPAALAAAAPAEPETDRIRATPLARRIARQNGVDIATVPGSGRRARVQAQDVEDFVAQGSGRADTVPAEGPVLLACDLPAGRIAYREWNAAGTAPLLLLHGFGGDAATWQGFAAGLARQGRRVLAPDLPAHGATTIAATGLEDLVEAVAAFLDRLAPGPVELCGHSLGGAVAARLARHPGVATGRLTLIAPAGLGSEIDADFIDGMAHASAGGGLAHLLRRVALRPPALSSRQLDAMAAMLGSSSLEALATTLVRGGRQQVDITGDLAALEGRVRLVWGLEDRIIPWTQAVHAGSAIPVHFIPEAGHMPQWDQPVKLAALFA
ncbi:acetoin dehydrogenase dihydrolipoyllysine-residue acetyltransferase subunit [Labrys wisconsinensis]|uniref:Pyruvate dehydrogenase E2 component (Dihydrolipoamide acetyltransferase) n=1 Tax=Labrys wisconsinensis TaxID=425677 RepID=A0ABU0JJP2_9HYPH|nr:acetoin dehydrogenase dihydrolipoyllysine-residue acetyltransferase subunit [Labrys wisconsinensis]MDQ0474484.1 pyruvate dehydrogenase E2 component (dihydrolipoamide acetyltransferase) [Labrys wisconsinensis]